MLQKHSPKAGRFQWVLCPNAPSPRQPGTTAPALTAGLWGKATLTNVFKDGFDPDVLSEPPSRLPVSKEHVSRQLTAPEAHEAGCRAAPLSLLPAQGAHSITHAVAQACGVLSSQHWKT